MHSESVCQLSKPQTFTGRQLPFVLRIEDKGYGATNSLETGWSESQRPLCKITVVQQSRSSKVLCDRGIYALVICVYVCVFVRERKEIERERNLRLSEAKAEGRDSSGLTYAG